MKIGLIFGAVLTAGLAPAAQAATVFLGTGTDAAAIQGVVDDFRAELGALNPNQPVNFDGGRRQIDWDAAPDAVADPNGFPGDFFNFPAAPRARGIEFSTPGDGFQLSSTAASGEPVQFGQDFVFEPFSQERLFTPVGSNVTIVEFFDPARPDVSALTAGLGVVFSDVDLADLTTMSFFDIDGDLLFNGAVPATEGEETFSFLGIVFDAPVVASVEIVTGNSVFDGEAFEDIVGGDFVVMDDFIFGEPSPIPLPATALLLIAGLGGLGGVRHVRRGR